MEYDLDEEIENMKRGEPPTTGALEYFISLRTVLRRNLGAALTELEFLNRYAEK